MLLQIKGVIRIFIPNQPVIVLMEITYDVINPNGTVISQDIPEWNQFTNLKV